jgi:C4-dicarboxylate-specific signal transduction histidine kinase
MGAAKMRNGEGREPTGKIGRGCGYGTPAALLLLGLLAAFLLVWTYLIGERQSKVLGWADAAMFVILFAWILIIAASVAGLSRHERRRRRAEAALGLAYEEMEQRVAIRTAELSDANRKLQEEIAERARAEMSLKMSEGEYRRLSAQFGTLLDTIPAPITLVSPGLKVMWANKGASVLSLPHPASLHCYEARHDRSTPCVGCPAEKSFLTGKAESARMNTPDGRHWDIRTVPVVKEGGAIEGVIEVASDITETVNLQAESMRAAHLASLGELAAGVAHEINNPVNGIINCAEILFNKSGEGTREHEISEIIIKEGNRIAFIVKSLLSFAREETEERMPARVQEILADSIALTEAQLRKEGITLTLDVPADLPPVLAQPQQLVQVFLNLINNSRYALGQKYPGKHEEKVLGITAREVAVDGRTRVRIVFRDQGTGIPANDLSRVIDPFFSTKPKGMGTGLGLSVSHGIILHHGGTISIDSVEGAFTEVAIELPVPEKR